MQANVSLSSSDILCLGFLIFIHIHVYIPLLSDIHYLSYGDCLDDKRENYLLRAVLCTTVVHAKLNTMYSMYG